MSMLMPVALSLALSLTVVQADTVIVDPHLVFAPDVSQFYPQDALREGVEGLTKLLCALSVEGLLIDCTIHQSSGHAELDAAAFRLAAAMRYSPRTENGRPVAQRVILPVRWALG